MIARIWTGATRTQGADAYQGYMREVALPGYADIAGNRAVLILRRPRNDDRTDSPWSPSGTGWRTSPPSPAQTKERAVFYPRDEQFLVDRELTVRHYQVYGISGLAGNQPDRTEQAG